MKLKRVEILGFKSFGKKTVLEFPEGITAIVGPNGSGKCVTGDTKVLLADGSSTRIDKLVNSRLGTGAVTEDGWLAPGDGTEVISLGGDLKSHKRPIKAFVKRSAPKELVKITTRSGRKVTTTPYHPLFTLQKGKVKAARADSLAEGLRIAIPREIRLPEPDKTFVELLDRIEVKDNLYVPHSTKLIKLVRSKKGKNTWKEVAKQADIPYLTIKGLVDGQSINFGHCIRLLRGLGIPDKGIIELIPEVKAKNYNKTCKIPWRNSPKFSRILGYLLAEGRSTDSNQIWFTNGTEEIVQDYFKGLTEIFGVRATINEYKSNAYDVLAYSQPIQVILEKFGIKKGGKTGDKYLSNLFFKHAGTKEISELLNGIYCGDGYIGKSCIEIIIKSKPLADAIEGALLRLGIVSQRKTVIKTATNSGFSGTYEKISFYDDESFRRFAYNLEMVHHQKAKRLNQLIAKTPNPNVDLIEVNDLVKKAAHEERINIKKIRKQFPKLDAYAYNMCIPSRAGVSELVQNVFSNSQSSLLLQQLCTSHIFWDEIASIESVEPNEPWVYDLCVEGDHNFVANNIFVHNSNVIDSICFALGYPSRNLRATRAAELIHSGKGGNLQHAKVALTFEKGKDALEVKRKVDRKGKSTYKLNSATTGLEGLHDTLTKHSIPKNGFNIVMQNDVMKFIEVKPKERRQILDQISGISGYEDKKKKSLDELGIVERRISDTNLILSEKKGYLEEIGKDREVALKYQGMQDELKKSKSIYLYSTLYELENKGGSIEKRIDQVNKEKEIKIVELARIDEEINNIENSLEKISKTIISTSGKESGEIKGEIGALKSGIERKQEEIQFLKEEVKEFEEKRAHGEEKRDDIKRRIAEHETELKGVRESVRNIEKRLVQKEQEREKKAGSYDNVELMELDKKRKAISEGLFEEKRTLSVIDSELEQIKKKEQELRDGISDRKEILKERKREVSEKEREISKLGAEAERVAKTVQSLDDTKSKLSELFQEFARVESEIKTIERIEAKRGESESLKLVNTNKEKGYIGKVSDLGSAPEKYKTALEAAAGAKSNCLVVKDDKSAQFYIEKLRKEKVGRATFLPLNKVSGPELKPIKGDGIVGFAKDLIKCDKKYQNIFDFVFGEALVVKDIETARRIGIGRIKMATLQGDIIAKGGAMTGGYYQKAAMTFSSTEEKKKKLEKIRSEITKLNDLKDRLTKQLDGKEKINVDVFRERKANLTEKVDRLVEKIGIFERELAELGEKKAGLLSKRDKVSKQVTLQERELGAVEGKMNMDALNGITELMEKIDREIHQIKDQKFEIQQKENAISNEIESMQSNIKEIDAQGSEFRDMINKYKQKLQDNINHITDSGRKLKEMEEKHSLVTEESRKYFAEQERLNQLIRELGEKRGSLEATIEKLRGESNDLDVRKAKIDTKLEEVRSDIHEVKEPSREDLKDVDIIELGRRVKELERELGGIEGVNLRAVEMYDELEKQYAEIKEKNEKLHIEKEKIYDLIETIEEKKKSVFYDSFYKVRDNFVKTIGDLYPGTEGNLVLENENDPFNSGLILEVKPRGRANMTIDSLSGGEKTLTALAFLISTQSVNPSPFYILDEVDASLDQENVLRLIKFLKHRKGYQFIMISHNPETVKHVDSVIGIHMQDGISKTVGVDMQTVEA